MSALTGQWPRVRPACLDDIRQIVIDSGTVVVEGWGRQLLFGVHSKQSRHCSAYPQVVLLVRRLKGIVDFSPDDLVVTVRAGTRLKDLFNELSNHNQCLPIGSNTPWLSDESTIGGLISMNLPHTLQAQCGSWHEWVLGLKVVLADGTVVHCGSRVTKNVAGFDAHKLFVGARGSLGIIAEITLRTFPKDSVPPERIIRHGKLGVFHTVIQRVRPEEFRHLSARCPNAMNIHGLDDDAFVADQESSTCWFNIGHDQEPRRFRGDWLLRSNCGARNIQITDPTQIALMKRTKAIFDPTNKLNPGEFGFL